MGLIYERYVVVRRTLFPVLLEFLRESELMMLLDIALAVFIFIVFVGLSFLVTQVLNRIAKNYHASTSEVFRLLANSQKGLLVFIGAVLAISKLGFDVSALVAGLGLTGFALGFALKDAISNLVAGMMIVIYQPIKLGNVIEVSGSKGEVMDIAKNLLFPCCNPV